MTRAGLVKAIGDFIKANGYAGYFGWQQEHYVKDRAAGVSIYAQIIGNSAYGWREQFFERDGDEVLEGSRQYFNTLVQLTFYAPHDSASDSLDLADNVKMMLQTEKFAKQFCGIEVGNGIRRISDIRVIQQQNDREQWETVPSFDVTFTHRKTLSVASGAVDRAEIKILRV